PFYVENLCFYRSGDEVKSRGKTVTKDAVSWAEEEAAMASKTCDDDISVTSVVDKGKRLADKGKGIMVDEGKAGRKSARSINSGIVIGENVNPSFSEDDDSDSDIDIKQRFKGTLDLEEMYKANTDSESEYSEKSIDYMSEGEDELISLRKRNGCMILVGEKYVDADQLKECLTYYSLTNGFSLWFYRSSKEHVIARCGMRPEKLKDIEKGSKRNTSNILVVVEMRVLIVHSDVMDRVWRLTITMGLVSNILVPVISALWSRRK
nr:pentatricopeptide repeat-containing protein [Tanacetum cinerariifolium]